jgi:hypothetical protein
MNRECRIGFNMQPRPLLIHLPPSPAQVFVRVTRTLLYSTYMKHVLTTYLLPFSFGRLSTGGTMIETRRSAGFPAF